MCSSLRMITKHLHESQSQRIYARHWSIPVLRYEGTGWKSDGRSDSGKTLSLTEEARLWEEEKARLWVEEESRQECHLVASGVLDPRCSDIRGWRMEERRAQRQRQDRKLNRTGTVMGKEDSRQECRLVASWVLNPRCSDVRGWRMEEQRAALMLLSVGGATACCYAEALLLLVWTILTLSLLLVQLP